MIMDIVVADVPQVWHVVVKILDYKDLGGYCKWTSRIPPFQSLGGA